MSLRKLLCHTRETENLILTSRLQFTNKKSFKFLKKFWKPLETENFFWQVLVKD